jgi:hypothetical protein
MKLRLLMLAGVSLLAACQSAKFNVRVDLYDEDPRAIVPMRPETATKLVEDVERLRAAASQKTALRIQLADGGWQIYEQAWLEAVPGARNLPAGFALHKDQHQRFVAEALHVDDELGDKLDDAVDLLNQYSQHYTGEYKIAHEAFQQCEKYRLSEKVRSRSAASGRDGDDEESADDDHEEAASQCQPYELTMKPVQRLDDEWVLRRLPPSLREEEAASRAAVTIAVEAYRGFAGPLKTAFIIDWAGLRGRYYTEIEIAQRRRNVDAEVDAKRALFALDGRIAALASSAGLPKSRVEDAVARNAGQVSPGLFSSMQKIAVELEALRADLPDDITAKTALDELVRNSSRFTELIDRLQDAGDSVWRIVTDPANEAHWNSQPVGTRFYAQGNSSVVVVRHDPMRYDVHEATNDPVALIKGQLAISHAVTKAALTVAGAASGMPGLTPKRDSSGNAVAPTDDERTQTTNTAEEFAKRKAARVIAHCAA